MSPFSIFRAFSGSSRGSDYRDGTRTRRSKIVKPSRRYARQEHFPEEFSPWSVSFAQEDQQPESVHHEAEYFGSGNIYDTQSSWPPSQIPAVHRLESHSRLHEMFSEQGDSEDLYLPRFSGVVRRDAYRISPQEDWESARPQIPVRVNSSSVGSSERIRSGQYQEAEEPQRLSSIHPIQRDFRHYAFLGVRPRKEGHSVPTFVRPDKQKNGVYEYEGDINEWDKEKSVSHSSESEQTHYIVPAGINVIFQDEYGNEITRVGDFSRRPHSSRHRPVPFIIQDEDGHELYRSGDFSTTSHSGSSEQSYYNCRDREHRNRYAHGHYFDQNSGSALFHEPNDHGIQGRARNYVQSSRSSDSRLSHDNIILIDDQGRQIIIASATGSKSSQDDAEGSRRNQRS